MAVQDSGLRARVELRMHELGMNQAALVRKSGVKQAAISHIQTKRTQMLDVPTLFKIADALECDPRWLAFGKE